MATVAKTPDNRHDCFTPLATEELADGMLMSSSVKATEGVDNDKIPQPMASTARAFATVSQAAASPITALAKAVGSNGAALMSHSCRNSYANLTREITIAAPSLRGPNALLANIRRS